jgi:membrane associated rhomboid family serine protease
MLIIVNIVVFFVTLLPDLTGGNWLYALFGESQSLQNVVSIYALVPAQVLHGKELYTLFTSMFLHGDLIHLGGNMLFLYVFGDNVEDTFGHVSYGVFYIIAGVVGSLAHVGWWVFSGSLAAENLPTIGASGAISGVLGAYLLLYPRAKIVTLIFFGWIWLIALPAIVFLGFWFVYQFLLGYFSLGGGVAYWAHIGGFMTGMLFGAILRGRGRKRVL